MSKEINNYKELSSAEIDGLIERCEQAITRGESIDGADLQLLLSALKSLLFVQERLQHNDLTIRRLRRLLGIVPSKTNHQSESHSESSNPENDERKSPANRSRHGKRKSDEVNPPTVVHHEHATLKAKDQCPDCGKGKLYKYTPAEFIRVTGEAPLQAAKHVVHGLRCNMCDKIFRAEVPEEVIKDGPIDQRFGYSAMVIVAIMKYFAGTPLYRQQSLQKMFGVKFSASTLWDQCERVANAIKPIYDELRRMAADGTIIYSDDTTNKILNQEPVVRVKRGSKKTIERTGVNSSGLIAQLADGKEIALFKTGINHAGEFLQEILSKRTDSAGTFIHMSDALSSNNVPHIQCQRALCNAHALRRFEDLANSFPDEVATIQKAYKTIYEIEDATHNMSIEQRLLHHQQRSKPIFENMIEWIERQFSEKIIEPNSTLGKEYNYILKHQEGLSAFYRYPGAPLDNNKQEQKLKLVVLHRKNSLFFKEPVGAAVADTIMSVCATASSAGINVFEYLKTIMTHQESVKSHPQNHLPWTVQKTSD